MTDRATRLPMLAAAVVFAVAAAACGGSSDDDDSGGSGGGGAEERTVITTEAGDPQDGGRVVFGLEAETSGFDPVTDRWAISAYQIASAIYDPLVAYTEDGDFAPYLAASVEPNEAMDEWTVTLRENVTFHDGTTLVADDVKYLYDQHRASALTKPVFEPVVDIEVVDPLTVKFVLDQPWATFPVTLAAQTGFVPSRATIDEEGGGLKPVGTGPFSLVSYEPDTAFIAKKYPGYWQEGLPHLDEIEFRPIVDLNSRMSAFDAGNIQIFTTESFDAAQDYREKCGSGACQMISAGGENEEVLVMLNTAVAPFDDPVAREALARATDRESLIGALQPGAVVANGPWDPDSPYYDPIVEETYPGFDLEGARELAAEYEEEHGEPIRFEFGATPSPAVQETANLLAEQWKAAGIEATIKSTEQTTYILGAVNGSFQANIWRQFGELQPDGAYIWWTSQNAAEPGTIGLNMARNKDPEIDEAMEAARRSEDPEERRKQYAKVAERLAIDLPYIWIYHSRWNVIAANELHGITNGPLPDGQQSAPFQGGVARVTYLWLEQ